MRKAYFVLLARNEASASGRCLQVVKIRFAGLGTKHVCLVQGSG